MKCIEENQNKNWWKFWKWRREDWKNFEDEKKCEYLWIGKSNGNVWKKCQWNTTPFGANSEGLHN